MNSTDLLMKPIPYGCQHVTEADIEAVNEVLLSTYLTTGPKVPEFEQAFADYIGSTYAVAVSSGTAALHLCTLALNVQAGQKVISTPLTFVASTNCVLYGGGEIDFVDISPQTLTLDIDQLAQKLSSSPPGTYQGIIPVDFAGYPVDMARIRQLADQHGCWIIEDSCHAPGGSFQSPSGKEHFCGDGSLADVSIFSFHPVKHIATGEGGMVTTNDPELYQRLLLFRNHGITRDPDLLSQHPGGWYYEMQELGYNYRMSDIHAALGLSQLRRAKAGLERRRVLARRYEEAFKDSHIQTPSTAAGHAYHLYVIRTPKRNGLFDFLRSHKIFVQVHYIPVHYQPYYQQLGWKKGDFPEVEQYYEEGLSLPMYPHLTEAEQDRVIELILGYEAASH